MRSSCLTSIFGAIAAVVSTSCFGDTRSSGSGFAIADGMFIITSNHVVDGCSSINIPDVGAATVLRSDRRADLAILRPNRPLAAGLRFRSGHPVRLGEEIVVIGFPLRGLLSSPPAVTTGIVSSLAGIRDDRTEMQISAPVQPGNSGGPVLDRAGNVVGVVESKLDAIKAARLTGDIPQNVNFAVHAAIVTSLLDSYSISYDIGLLEKEKPISDIVSTALPTIVVIECVGSGVVEKTPQLEARSRAVTPCAGNSDEQVIQPVLNLYDAIRQRDIERYADQWRADGVYVRANKGTEERLSERERDVGTS
jgi:S1-C subfamily serine protease